MDTIRRLCAHKHDHDAHRWWSRAHRMYFQCKGRTKEATS